MARWPACSPRPTGDPRRTCCRSRGRQNVRRTLPGEQPEPSGAKPAPNLNTDDHQAATASAHELGVGLVAFASGGAVNSPTHVSTGLGVACPRHGADGGMPQGQPVCDDFDAAVIRDRDVDVSQANVAGDPRPGFMSNRATARSRGRARDATTAGARARCDWQRQAKPS